MQSKWTNLAVFLVGIFVIQGVGSLATMTQIPTWYAGLEKAPWNPPSWVFGPVWTILYIMIAVAGWRLWINTPGMARDKIKSKALQYYFVQLVLNLLWSPIFFVLHLTELALVVLVLMIGFVVLTMREAKRFDAMAFWLLVPYLAWIVYAFTLNAAIVWLN